MEEEIRHGLSDAAKALYEPHQRLLIAAMVVSHISHHLGGTNALVPPSTTGGRLLQGFEAATALTELTEGFRVYAGLTTLSVPRMHRIRERLGELAGAQAELVTRNTPTVESLKHWLGTNSDGTGREPHELLEPVLPHVSRRCLSETFDSIEHVARNVMHLAPSSVDEHGRFSEFVEALDSLKEMYSVESLFHLRDYLDKLCRLHGINRQEFEQIPLLDDPGLALQSLSRPTTWRSAVGPPGTGPGLPWGPGPAPGQSGYAGHHSGRGSR